MSQRVFISYSRSDAAFASRLAADLRQYGADVWIDTEDIHAGVRWSDAIEEGLKSAQLMVLIHSPTAYVSENVKDEWHYFLDKKKPIIPILWLPTEVHFQLNRLQWVDFHTLAYETAFEKLRAELTLKGVTFNAAPVAVPPMSTVPPAPSPKIVTPRPSVLAASAVALAPAKPKFTLPLLEWINIPAGKVTLEKDGGAHAVAPFAIAKYPVTNAQFQAFIDDGGYRENRYWQGLDQRETAPSVSKWNEPTCPRETVNWYEAMAFTRWLSEKTGLTVTLPTEMQWQWAAISDKGWAYPYGNTFDKTKSNTGESGIRRTTPVDRYPQGASPFGVMDMSGNLLEWCLNEYKNVSSSDLINTAARSLRGGSWSNSSGFSRTALRGGDSPALRDDAVGFRVACNGYFVW